MLERFPTPALSLVSHETTRIWAAVGGQLGATGRNAVLVEILHHYFQALKVSTRFIVSLVSKNIVRELQERCGAIGTIVTNNKQLCPDLPI